MAEHGLPLNTGPVVGIAFDGSGFCAPDSLWGGEFLLADYRHFQRLAALPSVPLLGGAQAIRQPWRNTYAQLCYYFDWQQLCRQFSDVDIIRFLRSKPLSPFDSMLAANTNIAANR